VGNGLAGEEWWSADAVVEQEASDANRSAQRLLGQQRAVANSAFGGFAHAYHNDASIPDASYQPI
jgi:hypothetical protein